MKANLDGVEAWKGGDILPPGRYVCEIDDAKEGESKGGYPQLEIELRATEGDYKGGTIRDWIVVIPETYGKVRQLLEAADFDIPSGDFEIPVDRMSGRKVAIVVRPQPYNGETKNRVTAYQAVRAGAEEFAVAGGTSSRDNEIPF